MPFQPGPPVLPKRTCHFLSSIQRCRCGLVGADHVNSGYLSVGLRRTPLTVNHEVVGDSSLVDTDNVDSGYLGVGLKRTSLTVDHGAVEDIDEILVLMRN